jgi:hypothetical protein
MATGLKNSEQMPVADQDAVESGSRAGLATDPDSLLAVLNTIEHSVAVGFRLKTLLLKSTRRVGMSFH